MKIRRRIEMIDLTPRPLDEGRSRVFDGALLAIALMIALAVTMVVVPFFVH